MAASGPPAAAVARRRLGAEDAVVLACLAAVAALAWAWLIYSPAAGAPMDAMAMDAGPHPWSAGYLAPTFAMWTLMMVAMMLPSASPMILLHARVARQGRPGRWPVETLAFTFAYVALWTGFAALASIAQAALLASGAISAMHLRLGSVQASALLLGLAAAYNLSSAKRVCLDKCRSPLAFVMRGWRPGAIGAVRMGLAHGLFCLGCCWMLMALLFVGGAMNLAWVAVLTAAVVAEKYGPRWISGAVAALAAGAALVLLVRG